ncbi:MAG: lysozyme [Litoreibacter sp.]
MRKLISLTFFVQLAFLTVAASTRELVAETHFPTIPSRSASAFLIESFESGLGGAPSDSYRQLNDLGLEMIIAFEGLELRPYNDSAGYCTIGYGHLIAKQSCSLAVVGNFANGITADQARKLLANDAARAGRSVLDLTPIFLNDDQYGALTSFVFNLGAGNYANSTLLALLKVDALTAAAEQFPRWVKARNPETGQLERLAGLVARRNCESALFRSLLKQPFNRGVCEGGLGAVPTTTDLINVETGER